MDNDFVLMATPRTDGIVIFSKYEVETTKIEGLGLANTNGHSLSGFHFHDGNIFFFGSLTAVDCHHAYCYDIRTRETRRMDFGPLDEQANPLNESESVRFSRRYLTVANGSYFLLVRTRAEDDYSNALHYDDEHDYTDDWNDQLDPKARLFHLDLNVGKWQEITHRLLHEMLKLMLYETWDLLHFDPTHNGVLTIHSRLGEQFSDDSGTRSDHYSEHFRSRSLRFPIGSPESLINSSWFKLINTNGMHIRVPRNLPIRPLFTDCFDLNNVEFREDEVKAIVRLKHNHS
ncbi:hypothetical protein M3Y96_00152700 [Aphelenchoides besseyi]|nr:hypothetical protein M3Y96_00152700 [Aphelenchoides besseyi]